MLVLAGGAGWDSEIDAALAELPQHLRVIRPGFVPDDVLPGLLGGAEVVAYPSFGEGFGLPVLEAMACGATVLTTDRLSLPEVGGDAVAYAKSPDADDVAAALSELLADPARREALGSAAATRAATFGWTQTALGHRDVYESLITPLAKGPDT
jgi:glycosyltransferase involved in cell wall biosynthesis